ncbi:MAG: chloride channel protein [Eubacteriaceae bacterium]|jgi:H+/Cl- antiporter ClcA|nr:chloride channel protein [Eubacteriaceae bacterium]
MLKIKTRDTFLFVLLSAALGAAAGAIVWGVLKIMAVGIGFIWDVLPAAAGAENGAAHTAYCFAVCGAGGVIIGLFQKKYGIWPETLETVMGTLKRTGTYPYDRLPMLITAVLLPLIFGGCVGPEAGLSGIIVGLCCLVGDKLKYKGRQARELAETGMAATLSLVFGSPFYGIANNVEPSGYGNRAAAGAGRGEAAQAGDPEHDGTVHDGDAAGRNKAAAPNKSIRIAVYIAGVIGGFASLGVLSALFGSAMSIGRFAADMHLTWHNWIWFPAMAAAGILLGLLNALIGKAAVAAAEKISGHRVLSCVIAGLCLAAAGSLFPWAMFSGEEQMSQLMGVWTKIPAAVLLLIPAIKILMVNLCISFGWRGGNIFPVIFSGVSLGYALTLMTGAEPLFAVAVCTAAVCGYIMRKPVTVVAVLFLCFPLRAVIPLALAAFLASLVPIPWAPHRQKKEKGGISNEKQKDNHKTHKNK